MRAGHAAGDVNHTAIEWDDARSNRIVDPDTASSLLRRAAALAPANAAIRFDLGSILLEQFRFAEAAEAYQAALRIDPTRQDAVLRLARCWNRLGRYADVLALLNDSADASADALYLRGKAALGQDQAERAEVDFRAALDRDAHHREACFELGRILRDADRLEHLESLRAELWARGARHVQLLLDWGRMLADAGRIEEARRLLFTASKVTQATLDVPDGFATLADFNSAVADELAHNPQQLTDLPADEQAIRGSSRINHLMNGARPELILALVAAIKSAIARDVRERVRQPDDPWQDCRPARARLHAWANIQGPGGYEDWHAHRAGWLSGVYYVAIPEDFTADGDGAGCIEFGAPPFLAAALPETLRIAPREGMLLLMPSHTYHRTIPFASDGRRISFAFDVRPV
ncbi:2OG-Fe(II) oxygenase family protein [Amorphus sp. MBR-141]